MNDKIVIFRLHYGGVLLRRHVTEYRDFDYINVEREPNRVCMWSFTTELRSLGFKDSDVIGVYYKEPLKTLTDGMRLIHDEGSLYEMLSCASRFGLIELYVEHSEEWLRINNKAVDVILPMDTTSVPTPYKVGMEHNDESDEGKFDNEEDKRDEKDETSSDEDDGKEKDSVAELDANWYSDFRGEKLKMAFYTVAKCANEAQLRKRLEEIDNIKDGAKESLENKDIRQWCRAFFKSCSRCDSVDNNSTEAWNFVLIGSRSKPIISMNEDLREYLMERRIKRLSFVHNWRLNCGPNIRDIMNENSATSCKWKIKWNGHEEFQVYHGTTQHCVHLGDKTCTCGAWELSGIPCPHAIASIRSRSKDPYDYLDNCYSKDKFIAAYSYPIGVVGSEEFWPNSGLGELLPPIPKAMPGRPRKARRRRKFEPKKLKTKLSRHGRDMHCGKCNSIDHNSRTCSVQDVNTTMEGPDSGKKRKRRSKKSSAD